LQSDCDCKDEKTIINALKDIISTYPDKLIVLAMHHPLYTHGEHGGYYTLKRTYFSSYGPAIGSVYPFAGHRVYLSYYPGRFGMCRIRVTPGTRTSGSKVEDVIKDIRM